MATGKRFYWIKLRDNFFDDDGPADYLMSQPDGANYVVLYQMLCLKTINTDGRLSNKIGEVLIPYDIEKIRRTCKYFTSDTIRVAMNLYGVLGLIYEDRKGVLTIADFKSLVGSETDWAAKKQRQRCTGRNGFQNRLPGDSAGDSSGDSAGDSAGDNAGDSAGDNAGDTSGDTGGDNVPIEKRDKRVESSTLGVNNNINKNNNTGGYMSVSQDARGRAHAGVPAPAREDGRTDDELQEILDHCELEIFPASVQAIFIDAIERMWYSRELKVDKALMPQERVRSRLHQLDSSILQQVQHKLETNQTPIKNPTAYIMALIYTEIVEAESFVAIDPYLNSLKQEVT